MRNPNAVELVPTWNEGEYQIVGYWDGNYRHKDNEFFTKKGAEKYCKEHGYVICIRPRS